VGLKTGFTKKAGRCLVSAAERDGVRLIVVTLNCPDDWNVHQSLYDRYFDELQVEDLSSAMPAVLIPVTGGTGPSVQALSYDTAQVPVPVEGAEITYSIKAEQFLYAPVKSGQTIGEARIAVDGLQVATLTLVAGQEVPLKHPYQEETGILDWFFDLFG